VHCISLKVRERESVCVCVCVCVRVYVTLYLVHMLTHICTCRVLFELSYIIWSNWVSFKESISFFGIDLSSVQQCCIFDLLQMPVLDKLEAQSILMASVMQYNHSVSSRVQDCVRSSVQDCTLPLYVKVLILGWNSVH